MRRTLTLAFLLLLGPVSLSQTDNQPAAVTLSREPGLLGGTRAALRELPAGVRWAVLVRDVKTGEVLESQNADAPFIPASALKTVTGAAVLVSRQGNAGFWSTELTVPAAQSGKSVADALTLRGSADPTLSISDGKNSLRELARQAYAAGLRQVGAVRLDDGQGDTFAKTENGLPMPAVRLREWYSRPPRTVAGARERLGAALIAELRRAGITVKSERVGTAAVYQPYHPPARQDQNGNPLPPDRVIPLARRPEQAIASVQSGSVVPFVEATLRPSDNEQAEELLATLATGQGGTLQAALDHEKSILARLGLNVAGLRLSDGSGLGRESRLSARLLTDLMKVMYDLPYPTGKEALPDALYASHANAFAEALPLAGTGENIPGHGGRGGTMALRLVGSGLDVRAKTGTLPGVSNLTGYVRAKSGRLLTFAILMNGPESTPLLALRAVQDRAVQQIAAEH